jgi:hypothetical protein
MPAISIRHHPPAEPIARLTVLAAEIKAKLTIAQRHGRATLAALMDAGDGLIEAWKALDHGQWDDWLSSNFELSDRTARLYMQLAAHGAGRSQNGNGCHFGHSRSAGVDSRGPDSGGPGEGEPGSAGARWHREAISLVR